MNDLLDYIAEHSVGYAIFIFSIYFIFIMCSAVFIEREHMLAPIMILGVVIVFIVFALFIITINRTSSK